MTVANEMLQAESLVKIYGGKRVVDRVNVEVRRQEIVGLLGPNGAGKTTFGACFLYYGGVKHGEPGVYVSFAEEKEEFYIHMKALGILLLLTLVALVSCEKTTEYVCCPDSSSINGRYEFTLVPENSFQDTTLIKGKRGTDFPEYSTTYDDVYLYEDEEGNVIGNCRTWKITGTKSGQYLTLDLYVHPQGPVNTEILVENMHRFTTMNLMINKYGNLEGDGMYYAYEYYPELEDETYTIYANKIAGLSLREGEGNYRFSFCDVVSSISSFLISCFCFPSFLDFSDFFDKHA